MYADDCRTSKKIDNHLDAQNLQREINLVNEWVKDNGLNLNHKKCQKITFVRATNFLPTQYFIFGYPIPEVDSIKDLGVILDKKWSFEEHINYVVAKASKSLGFIKKLTKEFELVDSIIYLFKALVLATFTYSSIIWAPFQQNRFEELNASCGEKVPTIRII